MSDNTYRCEACQGIFEKGWTDEEAEDEYSEVFGAAPTGDEALVCDECYNAMFVSYRDD